MISVTDFTVDGKCSQCGACCSGVLPLSKYEVDKIRRYVKEHDIKEQRRNGLMGVDMTCPFRDERERKCLIYPVRPQICRSFMCNYNIDDLRRARMEFHAGRAVVFMRKTFFGNPEQQEYIDEYIASIKAEREESCGR